MMDRIIDSSVERAQQFLAMQRKRSLFFSNDGLFGDPAWELLLEIYIATEQHQCVSKSDLLENLSTTDAIASRWITVFSNHELIVHCGKHGADCICMTDDARGQCVAYLDAVMDL